MFAKLILVNCVKWTFSSQGLFSRSVRILECVVFGLFQKSQIPYSSWGLGVHMKLLGANNFDGTSKPTEYSAPQFLLYTAVIRNREKWKT